MPLFTGQERKPIRPHKLGRWYELSNGAIFRLHAQPRRVYGGDQDPETYEGDVELLGGGDSRLVWRFDRVTLLSPFWPRWLLRLVKPSEEQIAMKLLEGTEKGEEASHG